MNCFIIDDPVNNQIPIFQLTDIKIYVPVVTLSTQVNAKLLQQFISVIKGTINCNKFNSKIAIQEQKPIFRLLNCSSFQGVNRLFVLSFENTTSRASYK